MCSERASEWQGALRLRGSLPARPLLLASGPWSLRVTGPHHRQQSGSSCSDSGAGLPKTPGRPPRVQEGCLPWLLSLGWEQAGREIPTVAMRPVVGQLGTEGTR